VRSLVVLPSPSTPTRKRGLSLVESWPARNSCGIDLWEKAAVPSARPLIGCSRRACSGQSLRRAASVALAAARWAPAAACSPEGGAGNGVQPQFGHSA
jgi:hypothetical protein